VNVDATGRGRIEHRTRDNPAVRHHDRNVRPKSPKPVCELGRSDLGGLPHFEPQLERALLHGGRSHGEAAARWPVRLRDDDSDVANVVHCFEARHGKLGAAEKNGPHRPSLRGVGRGSFGHCAVHQPAAQHAEMVDHELAIEMIGFVLNGDRQQPFGFELERLAVFVERFDRDPFGPIDILTDTGKREAALVENSFTLGGEMISGLMKTRRSLGSSSSVATSTMNRRWEIPSCGAANPTPGAAYIVSAISSIS